MKITNVIWTLFVLLFLANCTPQTKLNNLLRKYPHLKKDSTTTSYRLDSTKAIDASIILKVDSSGGEFDSLFDFTGWEVVKKINDRFFIQPDTVTNPKIDSLKLAYESKIKDFKSKILNYVNTRRYITDTIIKIQDSITVKLYQQGGYIKISINRPLSVKAKPIKIVDNSVNASPCEVAWYYRWAVFGFVFLLIFIALLYFKRQS